MSPFSTADIIKARKYQYLWGICLVLAVFLTYLPVWHAGFIWDDDAHVTANPCIIGPLGLKEIWTTHRACYYPLVLTSFWIENALWGLQPLPYHLVNVFMHGACAVVLWRVLLALRVPGAWFGAALWALHPVQVETVSWITELKNAQSCLFYLLSILSFVRWLRKRQAGHVDANGWNYALTLLFAALAMASKSATVVLPLVLVLCAWWVEGRWHWRNAVRIAPILAMSVVASALAMWTVDLQGVNADSQWLRSWPERFITSGNVIWFYLGKLAWPHPLIFIYPRWTIDPGLWSSYLPLLAAIVVMSILWLKRDSWSRPYFFALAYFLVAILPVLGLVEHYFLRYSFVADHLQYLASMGPLALAGAGMARFADFALPNNQRLQSILGVGLLLLLGTLSWQRAGTYQNVETLWTDTLAQNPNCWLAQNDLGSALGQQGQMDQAMILFQNALKNNPNDARAHSNLGIALFQRGQISQAMAQFSLAIQLDPNLAEAHFNLGSAFLNQGKLDKAIVQFQDAVHLTPNNGNAQKFLTRAQLMAR
jgi:tetratricopeptide (TPR) repeat protein